METSFIGRNSGDGGVLRKKRVRKRIASAFSFLYRFFTIMAEGEYKLEDVTATSVAPEKIDETFHSGCIGK